MAPSLSGFGLLLVLVRISCFGKISRLRPHFLQCGWCFDIGLLPRISLHIWPVMLFYWFRSQRYHLVSLQSTDIHTVSQRPMRDIFLGHFPRKTISGSFSRLAGGFCRNWPAAHMAALTESWQALFLFSNQQEPAADDVQPEFDRNTKLGSGNKETFEPLTKQNINFTWCVLIIWNVLQSQRK